MQLVEVDVYRALLYVGMASRAGIGPSKEELDVFANRPDRWRSRTGGLSRMIFEDSGIARAMETLTGKQVVEPYSDYLIRLGWVRERAGRCVITPLGMAVRFALDLETSASNGDLLTTIIDPEDDYAYPRVLERIGNKANSLIVDAYLKIDGYVDLRGLDSVQRILTSDEHGRNPGKIGAFRSMVPRDNLELRLLDTGRLHDRYVIPSEGSVLQLSTSLNSVGKRIGVLVELHDAASAALRDHFEILWKEAKPMERADVD